MKKFKPLTTENLNIATSATIVPTLGIPRSSRDPASDTPISFVSASSFGSDNSRATTPNDDGSSNKFFPLKSPNSGRSTPNSGRSTPNENEWTTIPKNKNKKNYSKNYMSNDHMINSTQKNERKRLPSDNYFDKPKIFINFDKISNNDINEINKLINTYKKYKIIPRNIVNSTYNLIINSLQNKNDNLIWRTFVSEIKSFHGSLVSRIFKFAIVNSRMPESQYILKKFINDIPITDIKFCSNFDPLPELVWIKKNLNYNIETIKESFHLLINYYSNNNTRICVPSLTSYHKTFLEGLMHEENSITNEHKIILYNYFTCEVVNDFANLDIVMNIILNKSTKDKINVYTGPFLFILCKEKLFISNFLVKIMHQNLSHYENMIFIDNYEILNELKYFFDNNPDEIDNIHENIICFLENDLDDITRKRNSIYIQNIDDYSEVDKEEALGNINKLITDGYSNICEFLSYFIKRNIYIERVFKIYNNIIDKCKDIDETKTGKCFASIVKGWGWNVNINSDDIFKDFMINNINNIYFGKSLTKSYLQSQIYVEASLTEINLSIIKTDFITNFLDSLNEKHFNNSITFIEPVIEKVESKNNNSFDDDEDEYKYLENDEEYNNKINITIKQWGKELVDDLNYRFEKCDVDRLTTSIIHNIPILSNEQMRYFIEINENIKTMVQSKIKEYPDTINDLKVDYPIIDKKIEEFNEII